MTGPVGFIGLGNMGSVLASNLVEREFKVVAHDLAGPERCPDGATFSTGLDALANRCSVVVLSLPDGKASLAVARQIVDNADRRTTHIVDTSTVGLDAALAVDRELGEVGIALIDAPVSGGPAGARARTLSVMYAGDDSSCQVVDPVLRGLSDRLFKVGSRPGMGQAMKLANNFLSATALAATSEAVAFGASVGLSASTMLEVLNASSGASSATTDKFPTHVVTGRYASGFANTLMAKDVALYVAAAANQGVARALGNTTAEVWERFAHTDPGADFTRIYPFTASS